MAAISLDSYPDSFSYGKCNLTDTFGVINASCTIEKSLKYFISSVHLAFINHVFHVIPGKGKVLVLF